MAVQPILLVSNLRARAGTAGATIVLSGYYATGDGGGDQFYWDNTSTDADDGALTFAVAGVSTGRWKRKILGSKEVDVRHFGITGGGIDESTKIQTMFNTLSGKVRLSWGNTTYRFYGVTVPVAITHLIMVFNNTTWTYPLRNAFTSPVNWNRFHDATGGDLNFQLRILGTPKIELKGALVMDGEARLAGALGNVYNVNVGATYSGQGMASAIQVVADNIGKLDSPAFTYTGSGQWIITSEGFTTNQLTGSYTSGHINFTRDPIYHYRISFTLTIRSGTVYYNPTGTVGNATTVSTTKQTIIFATSGAPAAQTYYWLGTTGTNADVTNIIVERCLPYFGDSYIKTNGSFTIRDHGFSPFQVNSGNDMQQYDKVHLKDWTFDETVIGGHRIRGFYNSIWLDNYKVFDRYAKSWIGFVEEGARGFGISAVNTSDPTKWSNSVKISRWHNEYASLPSITSAHNVQYQDIYATKYGRFIGADNIERDLNADDLTAYALPLPAGGQLFKVDLTLYSPDMKFLVENVVIRNTSQTAVGASLVWENLWLQAGVKHGVIRNCVFDSNVILSGTGDTSNSTTQSWSFRNHVDNCEFLETGTLSPAYGTQVTNCRFTRSVPLRGTNVDYPRPAYVDWKLAIYLHSTNTVLASTFGTGESFQDVIFESCLFVARYFFPSMYETNAMFNNCTFIAGSWIYLHGSSINRNFDIRIVNCKRLTILFYSGSISVANKANSLVSFRDCEIIITGYTGASDLDTSTSSIRRILDATSYKWNNLKIYNATGTLLHDLKGFEWLREPTLTSSYGIEGAYYINRTTGTRYDYISGAWIRQTIPTTW